MGFPNQRYGFVAIHSIPGAVEPSTGAGRWPEQHSNFAENVDPAGYRIFHPKRTPAKVVMPSG